METRRIAGGWPWFRLLALGLLGLALASQTAAQIQALDTRPLDTPPDHFDADDLKSFEDVQVEDRSIVVRGQEFVLHLYRPKAAGAVMPVIYACGDGGWRGLAPRTAQQLAHQGLAVVGLDSKEYLREFSTSSAPLTIAQIARDYVVFAGVGRKYAGAPDTDKVMLYGWSLGAGFAVGVGADRETRANWAGVVSIGLPKQNQLVSGVRGNRTDLDDSAHARFGFRTADLISQIAPLPLVMIQSTKDTASSPETGRSLFAAAGEPKQYILLAAANHRFTSARQQFYEALDHAWIWESGPAAGGLPMKKVN